MNTVVFDFAELGPMIFQPTEGQVYADLAGELAILNSKTGIYYGLDPVGARIWSLILEFKTVAEVKGVLLEEYDADPEQVESDLVTLVSDLQGKGLIERAPEDARERAGVGDSDTRLIR